MKKQGLIYSAVFILACAACQKAEQPKPAAQQPPKQEQAAVPAQPQLPPDIPGKYLVGPYELGKTVKSPITGKSIVVAPETPASKYLNELYFFSSEKEREQFNKDPKKYASKMKPGEKLAVTNKPLPGPGSTPIPTPLPAQKAEKPQAKKQS